MSATATNNGNQTGGLLAHKIQRLVAFQGLSDNSRTIRGGAEQSEAVSDYVDANDLKYSMDLSSFGKERSLPRIRAN